MPRAITTPTKPRKPLPIGHLDVHVDQATLNLLDSHIANNRHRGATRVSEVTAAIHAYIKPQDPTPALFRAVNRLENHLATAVTRIDMLGAAFLHFLRYYFVPYPDFPESVKRDAELKANDKLAKYLRSLQRRTTKKDAMQFLDPQNIANIVAELNETIRTLVREHTDSQGDLL